MAWKENTAHFKHMQNAYKKFSWRTCGKQNHLEDIDVDGRAILKFT
jgi:hypothetical protein